MLLFIYYEATHSSSSIVTGYHALQYNICDAITGAREKNIIVEEDYAQILTGGFNTSAIVMYYNKKHIKAQQQQENSLLLITGASQYW